MASAAFPKTWIFHRNTIRDPLKKESQNRIAFNTRFFDCSDDFIGKWGPKMGPDFNKNRSKKGMNFGTRFGKGLERVGKGLERDGKGKEAMR